MFAKFNEKERAVHYPEDRKFYIKLSRAFFLFLIIVIVLPIAAAWAQYLVFGLPVDPSKYLPSNDVVKVKGFPMWLIFCHWINFFFLIILIRSGLSILFDHPRLYWKNNSIPGSEWLKFTPKIVPPDKSWTAKDDARYISPAIGLPGYRHSVGIARGWHFIHVPLFVLTGLFFIVMLFTTSQWQRVVPASFQIIPDSWNVFVHYVTFNLPIEPNGFYNYNALQKLSYFVVIFILAPLAILSGMCMSPSIGNRFPLIPKLFGNRQGARSVHFIIMFSYLIFIIIHVSLVVITGFVRNMNHITVGTDNESSYTGIIIFSFIILFTLLFHVFAHWVSWRRPRWIQFVEAKFNGKLWRMSINKLKPKAEFKREDISHYFWTNGKLPISDKWKTLVQNDFKDYKLIVEGLVENPIEISIDELKSLGKEQNITLHHCIQGWTGVAEWGGLPLKALIDLVKPLPNAKTVAFYSFGEGMYGGKYYDTHTIDNCLKPQSILAWEMNYEPLPLVYGAPLRLRVENQLGYKMVKWIERIEFIESPKAVGKGYGGKNEDDEYFDLIANT